MIQAVLPYGCLLPVPQGQGNVRKTICCNTQTLLTLISITIAKILEELIAYAKQFSQRIGHHFTRSTIRLTALTGSAASEINGETTAREFGLCSTKDFATQEDISEFADTRMNIVDEISFADHDKVLAKLSHNLQTFTECREFQFGRIPIVFLGDFRQLEPIGGDALYKYPHSMYWEQALTCMVELKGTHRFRNCKIMKRMMPEIRETDFS